MQEILKISQQPNERLRVLTGWKEDAARKYSETVELLSSNVDKLIKMRFKHPIADQEARNLLLWDQTEKAQQFKDFRSNESMKLKRLLRTTDSSSEISQLW